MYVNLPLNFNPKQDSPKRLSLLSGVPVQYFTPAVEWNKLVAAVDELYGFQKESEISTSNVLKFNNAAGGVVHGGVNPIIQNLVIDPANKVEGGMVEVIWTGAANPNITGVAAAEILTIGQTIIEQGTYSILMIYTGGKYKVNITPKNTQYVGGDGGQNPSSEVAGILTITDSGEVAGVLTIT